MLINWQFAEPHIIQNYLINLLISAPTPAAMSTKQRAVVICGFPCIGKTYLTGSWTNNEVHDMESFGLSHTSYDAMLSNLATKEKSIILVGTSPDLRPRMQEMGLVYVRVYPRDDPRVKEAWINRQWRRDRDEAACDRMRTRWNSWLRKVQRDFAGEKSTKSWELAECDYLESLIPEIVQWFENNVF